MHEWAAVCWWAGAEVGGQVARNSKNKEEGGGGVVRVRRGEGTAGIWNNNRVI